MMTAFCLFLFCFNWSPYESLKPHTKLISICVFLTRKEEKNYFLFIFCIFIDTYLFQSTLKLCQWSFLVIFIDGLPIGTAFSEFIHHNFFSQFVYYHIICCWTIHSQRMKVADHSKYIGNLVKFYFKLKVYLLLSEVALIF